MKIYKHEYDAYRKEITTREIEVVEKPKTYAVISRNIGFYERVVKKSEIGVLQGRYGKKMFTLSPSKQDFLKALIDRTELHIKSVKEDLQKSVEEKTLFLKALDNENKEIEAKNNGSETVTEM